MRWWKRGKLKIFTNEIYDFAEWIEQKVYSWSSTHENSLQFFFYSFSSFSFVWSSVCVREKGNVERNSKYLKNTRRIILHLRDFFSVLNIALKLSLILLYFGQLFTPCALFLLRTRHFIWIVRRQIKEIWRKSGSLPSVNSEDRDSRHKERFCGPRKIFLLLPK